MPAWQLGIQQNTITTFSPPWYPEVVQPTNSRDNASGEGLWATDGKHPDWRNYPEFYWDGAEYHHYTGTAGAYDPNVFVVVDYEH